MGINYSHQSLRRNAMLLTREYIDKAFWQKLIAIGLPVSLQSMLFALLGVVDIFMVSLLANPQQLRSVSETASFSSTLRSFLACVVR